MTILITGANGQLGRETILALQADGVSHIALGRGDVDFARPNTVAGAIADYAADWVINCAAYTGVDKAEEERELAFTVNSAAARAVAEGVKRSGGKLLHLSTDFVFGGERSRPYEEDSATGPLGVYGQSKLSGERAVREVMPEAIILRTAWVYGLHGHNFVKTILRLAADRQELRVVDDQVGTPSWTADIVRAMRKLISMDATGTYHFTNEGVASWYDFACEIISFARALDVPLAVRRIHPISTGEFPLPATRPGYSVMCKAKVRAALGYQIPYWRDSLHDMIEELAATSSPQDRLA